jgi:hypothetical protein
MARSRKLDEKTFHARWRALPEADRRFLSILGTIMDAVDGEALHYIEPSARQQRTLAAADRDSLFSLIVECLCCLLSASVLERVKRSHRKQRTTPQAPPKGRTRHTRSRRSPK